MPTNCPKCRRPIYNRLRRTTCEFCNAPIPKSHQIPPNKRAQLKVLKEAEARAHPQWMERNQSDRSPDLPHFGGF
jgi:hypothetical protein